MPTSLNVSASVAYPFSVLINFHLIKTVKRIIMYLSFVREVLFMELDWITPQQAAEKWGIKDRRVQAMWANGDIEGVIKLGRVWLIPKDALRPKDGRVNNRRVVRIDKSDIKENVHND